jgi:hypothetical protein
MGSVDWPAVLSALGVATFLGVLIVTGVRFLEGQNERGRRATALQERIAGPISREPSLASASILPVARLRRFGRSEVELTGQVPSAAARTAVVRIAEREIARSYPGARIVDHLEVVVMRQARRSA